MERATVVVVVAAVAAPASIRTNNSTTAYGKEEETEYNNHYSHEQVVVFNQTSIIENKNINKHTKEDIVVKEKHQQQQEEQQQLVGGETVCLAFPSAAAIEDHNNQATIPTTSTGCDRTSASYTVESSAGGDASVGLSSSSIRRVGMPDHSSNNSSSTNINNKIIKQQPSRNNYSFLSSCVLCCCCCRHCANTPNPPSTDNPMSATGLGTINTAATTTTSFVRIIQTRLLQQWIVPLLNELWWSTDSLFQNKYNYLLLFGPLAVAGDTIGIIPKSICFLCAGISLIPLAERLSFITEQISEHTNTTIGSLLNATFGNAPELLIAIAAIRSGYYRMIHLTLLGSIMTNLLFVLGLACFIGGCHYQNQSIRIVSGHIHILMLWISIGSCLFPAILVLSGQLMVGVQEQQQQQHRNHSSNGNGTTTTTTTTNNDIYAPTPSLIAFGRLNAMIMWMIYFFYLIFQLGSHKDELDDDTDGDDDIHGVNYGLPLHHHRPSTTLRGQLHNKFCRSCYQSSFQIIQNWIYSSMTMNTNNRNSSNNTNSNLMNHRNYCSYGINWIWDLLGLPANNIHSSKDTGKHIYEPVISCDGDAFSNHNDNSNIDPIVVVMASNANTSTMSTGAANSTDRTTGASTHSIGENNGTMSSPRLKKVQLIHSNNNDSSNSKTQYCNGNRTNTGTSKRYHNTREDDQNEDEITEHNLGSSSSGLDLGEIHFEESLERDATTGPRENQYHHPLQQQQQQQRHHHHQLMPIPESPENPDYHNTSSDDDGIGDMKTILMGPSRRRYPQQSTPSTTTAAAATTTTSKNTNGICHYSSPISNHHGRRIMTSSILTSNNNKSIRYNNNNNSMISIGHNNTSGHSMDISDCTDHDDTDISEYGIDHIGIDDDFVPVRANASAGAVGTTTTASALVASRIQLVGPTIPLRIGIVWLFIITICISTMSDILVDTIDDFASHLHISEVFTSMIIIPFFSNIAEQVSAILFAYRNEMDLCIGVTVGSAIQIASFVLPGTVILGMIMNRSMTLYLHGYETMSLFFAVLVVNTILQGGTTNWMVGVILLSIYIMFATGIWFHSFEDLTYDEELLIQQQLYTNHNHTR